MRVYFKHFNKIIFKIRHVTYLFRLLFSFVNFGSGENWWNMMKKNLSRWHVIIERFFLDLFIFFIQKSFCKAFYHAECTFSQRIVNVDFWTNLKFLNTITTPQNNQMCFICMMWPRLTHCIHLYVLLTILCMPKWRKNHK